MKVECIVIQHQVSNGLFFLHIVPLGSSVKQCKEHINHSEFILSIMINIQAVNQSSHEIIATLMWLSTLWFLDFMGQKIIMIKMY